MSFEHKTRGNKMIPGRCKDCGEKITESNHSYDKFYKCPKCEVLNKLWELLPE